MQSPSATGTTADLVRRVSTALAAACTAMVIVACGSSSKPSPATAGGGQAASLVNFAVCMRSHGVLSFPDATASAAGGVSVIPDSINTSSPAFTVAWSICNKLLPGLGAHHPPSARATEQMLRFSECMRGHGVTGFPDPTATPPSNRSGCSLVVRRGEAYLAVPDTITATSPIYKQAAAACRFEPTFS
jgi:hypothetical protein